MPLAFYGDLFVLFLLNALCLQSVIFELSCSVWFVYAMGGRNLTDHAFDLSIAMSLIKENLYTRLCLFPINWFPCDSVIEEMRGRDAL